MRMHPRINAQRATQAAQGGAAPEPGATAASHGQTTTSPPIAEFSTAKKGG